MSHGGGGGEGVGGAMGATVPSLQVPKLHPGQCAHPAAPTLHNGQGCDVLRAGQVVYKNFSCSGGDGGG